MQKGRFVALSPKTYYCFNAEDYSKKIAYKGNIIGANLAPIYAIVWYHFLTLLFKGVCHTESKRLKLEHYLACLYENEPFIVKNRGFKCNRDRQMIYYELPKEGLNGIFLKFQLEPDLITCKPLKINGEYL